VQELVGVDAGAQAEDAIASRSLSLSICAVARRCSSRLVSVLAQLHPLADEIVVALDERAELEAGDLTRVANRIVLFPHRDPADSVIPWLHAQCRAGWILNVDDDEVPSSALLRDLPRLLSADVTHWWLPRRWLVRDEETWLDEPPWVPDYQLRLYRNDPETLRFSDEFHRPVVVAGPAGFARQPLWHLDCLLNSFERRREKALAYERARRGMRVAGLAHNSAFYLPELRPDARTAHVPAEDTETIRAALHDGFGTPRLRRGWVRRAERREIDAYWPGEPHDPSLWSASLEPLARLDSLPAGAEHTTAVHVVNKSAQTWRRGSEAAPLILVGSRWLDAYGNFVGEGVHTPLPADLRPGEGLDMPVHVRAPARPGRYRLSIDLVHEHVRWFGRSIEWPFDVTPSRRVAVIGAGERLQRTLDSLHLQPELEPFVAPSLESFLLADATGRIGPFELAKLAARTARLFRRARRLRDQRPTAPLGRGGEEWMTALAGCERLIVAGPDWDENAALTRQLWRLVATTRAAKALRVQVDVARDEFAPTGLVDRLLTNRLPDSARSELTD
jgi:hypothetical protein